MVKITLEWFLAALTRALKTIAQVSVGMIGVGAAINEINWGYIASVSLVAGLLSLLTSLAGLPEVVKIEKVDEVNKRGVIKTRPLFFRKIPGSVYLQ